MAKKKVAKKKATAKKKTTRKARPPSRAPKEGDLTAIFEGREVVVERRSVAHKDDQLVSTAELAHLLDDSAPRMKETLLSAGVDIVAWRGQTKIYWAMEALSLIARDRAAPKLKKGEKKSKHRQQEDEVVTALEQRRIKKLDIEIAKSEGSWIPKDIALLAISNFQQAARSIFTSTVPLLKRKAGNDIAPSVYTEIESHISQSYNLMCRLPLDIEEDK